MPSDPQTAADLRWMARVNPLGIGLFGPTLRRFGPVPECERLVSMGYATRRMSGSVDRMGYWITEAGRAALAAQERGK